MATRILETKQENHHPVSYFSHYGNEGKGAGQAVSPGFIRGSAGLVAANSLPRLQPGPDLLGARKCRQGSMGSEWPGTTLASAARRVRCELPVRVYRSLMTPPTISPPHRPQTTRITSWRQVPPHLLGSRREEGITNESFWKWPLLVPAWARTNAFEWTTCFKQHLKYGTFSTLWYETPPSLNPIYCSACRLPGEFFCLSAGGMDGIRQMLHKAFISPRRLRARRINLLLLGPLPQASGETVNWAWQGR